MEVYKEFYFGIGLGYTVIDGCQVVILPFVIIMIVYEE
jgi:hypothetical protein